MFNPSRYREGHFLEVHDTGHPGYLGYTQIFQFEENPIVIIARQRDDPGRQDGGIFPQERQAIRSRQRKTEDQDVRFLQEHFFGEFPKSSLMPESLPFSSNLSLLKNFYN